TAAAKVQISPAKTEAITVRQPAQTQSQTSGITATDSGFLTMTEGNTQSILTRQLTKTLKVANGPPSSQAIAKPTVTSNSASSQNKGKYPVLPPAGASGSPAPSIPDLYQDITTELNAYQNGTVTGTVNLSFGNVSLGGVLSFTGAAAVFNVTYSAGAF